MPTGTAEGFERDSRTAVTTSGSGMVDVLIDVAIAISVMCWCWACFCCGVYNVLRSLFSFLRRSFFRFYVKSGSSLVR